MAAHAHAMSRAAQDIAVKTDVVRNIDRIVTY
jgi:hypothetical protein